MRNFQWTEPLFPKIYSVVPCRSFLYLLPASSLPSVYPKRIYLPIWLFSILPSFPVEFSCFFIYRIMDLWTSSLCWSVPPSCRFSFFVFVDLWNLPSRLEFTILSSVSLLLPFSSEEEEPLDLRLVFPFLDFNISAGGYIVNIFHLWIYIICLFVILYLIL